MFVVANVSKGKWQRDMQIKLSSVSKYVYITLVEGCDKRYSYVIVG